MSASSWYSFADPTTGLFDDVHRWLPEDQVELNTPAGMVAVPGEHDARRCRFRLGPDDFGQATVPIVEPCLPPRPDDTEMSTWTWSEQLQDWVEQQTLARLARAARGRRDELMRAADWVTLRAYRSGTAVPEEWATYLQALADVPQQPGFPTAIDWPTPPST